MDGWCWFLATGGNCQQRPLTFVLIAFVLYVYLNRQDSGWWILRKIPADINPVEILPLGNYAVGIYLERRPLFRHLSVQHVLLD